MSKHYHPEEIEKKWQARWEKEKVYQTPKKGKKTYCLSMFPYPSGAGLHVGHVRIYTGTDVLARFFKAQGYRVLHPMGWDAFGLPAENDALRNKINPNKLVPKNIANFKRQMKMMGLAYDWEKEIDTSKPSFYHWTQWLFLKLYDLGLIYKKKVAINWCPSCQTGLANEEVLPGGVHERCGKAVTKKDLPQWLFKITTFADQLLEDLKGLDWPQGILQMQKNWIGKSQGVMIKFPIAGKKETIATFTTRPDTLFGVTFFCLAPEHPAVSLLVKPKYKKAVGNYQQKALRKTELERISKVKAKTGVFTGGYLLNPLSGKQIPVYVADYVVTSYGTGAVMGVPAHDQRDWDFAKKHQLEIVEVVLGGKVGKKAYSGEGKLINSAKFSNLASLKARKEILSSLGKKGLGKKAVQYHLRDWVFSRQRYWGEPIPLVYCDRCGDKNGVVPVPFGNLPVKLPYVEKYQPTGTGESPLAGLGDWVKTKCPKCGGPAKRETDTMPNWAGSCWYFLRFADPDNKKAPFSKEKAADWLPVDWYLGGAEHAVLHLLYSRFWIKAFKKMGLVDFNEPFKRLRNVGMVWAEDGRKMSKSLGNVVNPDEVVKKFGADTLRVYEMFMAPFGQPIAWNGEGVWGAYRFLGRVFRAYQEKGRIGEKTSPKLKSNLHRLIKKVGEDIVALKGNTAVAAMMEFLSLWKKEGPLSKEDAGIFAQILAPFAPHFSEELWCQVLGKKFSVHQQSWPKFDPQLIKEETVVIIIQVGGKVRGQLKAKSSQASERLQVETAAKKAENVARHLKGKKIKKVVFVPGRLINFVV